MYGTIRNITALALLLTVVMNPGCRRKARDSTTVSDTKEASSTEAANAMPVTSEISFKRTNRRSTRTEKILENADPAAAGWPTEVLSDASNAQLKRLAEWITGDQKIDASLVESLISPDYSSPSLCPDGLSTVFQDETLVVRRWLKSGAVSPRGDHRFAEVVSQLREKLKGSKDRRAKLKTFKIEVREDEFVTRVFFQASNKGDIQSRQLDATWTCRWSHPATESTETPRLKGITLDRYEETSFRAKTGTLFEDCTASVFRGNASYDKHMKVGIGEWLLRISRLHGIEKLARHGVTVGDINSDGLDDLYVPEAGGLPNRMFRQNADGTVTDVSAESGTDWIESSSAALLVDLDNDGDQDLVVAARPRTLFMENDGTGRFALRAAVKAASDPTSLVVADFDGDADLDVYVCGYNHGDKERNAVFPVPFQDANNGGTNSLLRNDGGFKFVDMTAKFGLDENNRRFSFAAACEDYDNDGDIDLYVANDFGRNNLYENQGDNQFVDVADRAGVEDMASGMSVSFGDFNRDGLVDLYVGNMFSAAGNRITFQRQFVKSERLGELPEFQRMARGNSLFQNVGDGTFRDVSHASGTMMGRWSWASRFADLNNDGWEDLVVTNGFLTSSKTRDL